ncbi:DotA/TraY family protein [Gluconobacter kondonii]|uniref:DotA/TraY family protein n=1 Tax=Gluconobacter kondonii TaxID=941463 RepID=UPI001B8C48A8|nr:DotA/TraY family protein [Gluconobacter kondonii]MBS1058212.1 DotA/TraY family protein [Gluconobacter kondonii]
MTSFRRFRNTGRALCALPILLATGMAHAQSVTGNSTSGNSTYGVTWNMLDPGDDWAATMIKSVFPVFGSSSTSTGTEATVIGTMLGDLSGFVMALAMAFVSYVMMMNMHRSAETSKVLGSNQTSMSIVRMAFGAIMMLPVAGGFSAGQAAFVQGSLWGVGMAKTVYSSAVQAIGPDGKTIAMPMVPGTKTIVAGLIGNEMCRDLVNLASSNSSLVPAPTGQRVWAVPGADVGVITYPYQMTTGDGQPVCGSVTIQAPRSATKVLGITVDTAAMQQQILDSVLVGEIRPQVQQVATQFWQTKKSSSLAPLVTLMTQATNDYTSKLTAKAASIRQQVQAAVMQRSTSFQAWDSGTNGSAANTKNRLDSLGWTGAGAYYLEFARLNGETMSLMASTPSVSAPTYVGLGEDLHGDIAPLMQSTGALLANISNMVATQDGMNAPGGSSDLYTGVTPTGDGAGILSRVARSLHLSDYTLQTVMAFIEPSGAEGYWTDPFGNLMGLGNWMITTALLVMASAALLSSDAGSAVTAAGAALTGNFAGAVGIGVGHVVVQFLSTPILTGAMALLLPGLTLAFVLPMIPWVMWMAGVAGWLILVCEGVIAVPLWMLAHMTMSGEGLHGHAKAGYALIFNVLFRPTLMLFGLFLGYFVFDAMSWLIHQTFGVAAGFVLSHGWIVTNLIGVVVMLGMYVTVHITLALMCFRLIAILPERVPAMIGFHEGNRVDLDQFSRDAAVVGMAGTLQGIQRSLAPQKGSNDGQRPSAQLVNGVRNSPAGGNDTTMQRIT